MFLEFSPQTQLKTVQEAIKNSSYRGLRNRDSTLVGCINKWNETKSKLKCIYTSYQTIK